MSKAFALPILQATADASPMVGMELPACFGALMEMPAEQLRDLPGKPQQVMLAQTLYYLKSTTPLLDLARQQKGGAYAEVVRIIDMVDRIKPMKAEEEPVEVTAATSILVAPDPVAADERNFERELLNEPTGMVPPRPIAVRPVEVEERREEREEREPTF